MNRFARSGILVATVLVCVVFYFVFLRGIFFSDSDSAIMMNAETIKIEGRSMEPLIHSGSVLTQTLGHYDAHGVERGDIVTFLISNEKRLLVKRIVAIPGDKVTLVDRSLYVNEEQVKNSKGVEYEIKSEFLAALLEVAPIVPAGSVLVLADQRRGSMDSSRYGFIPIATLVGKVLMPEEGSK